MIQPCPVCGGTVTARLSDSINGTVCESDEHCPVCGWAYEFSYGRHAEWIGRDEFGWSWTETVQEREERAGRRADAINRRRAEVTASSGGRT